MASAATATSIVLIKTVCSVFIDPLRYPVQVGAPDSSGALMHPVLAVVEIR